MHEELRRIGLKIGMQGTGLLEEIIRGRKSSNDLTAKEIKEVLAAWDTRNYVPIDMKDNVDKVRPIITIEEVESGMYTMEQYERNYVEMIERYLKTLM